jgi:hypothetical protein
MNFNVPSRTQTPPEIKWLLVERATLVGDIEQLARRRALLDTEMEDLQSRVAALDTSIRLLDARVHAAAAGKVFRHCPQYNRRGALKAFIVQDVGETDEGLSVHAIAAHAAAYFGKEFLTKAEFLRYCHNSIRPQLQLLREEGLLESVQGSAPGGMLLWRHARALPTFAELARLSGAAHDKVLDCEQNQD